MKSSYDPYYGPVFFSLIEAFRPMMCVELGVLNGYSTNWIAKGLKHNHKNQRHGENKAHLDAYDLWDSYPYNHGDKATTQRYLCNENVGEFVTLLEGDAFECHEAYADKSIHFLHVDISNTGEILRRIMELWDKKIPYHGIIAFEGGSEERDSIEWMTKFKKEPIRPELLSNKIIESNYVYGVYKCFPSLTIMLKKWENI